MPSRLGGLLFESLGEPAVDVREDVSRLVPPALVHEPVAQARCRSQLERPGVLAPGDVESGAKVALCLRDVLLVPRLAEHEQASAAEHLGGVKACEGAEAERDQRLPCFLEE